MNKPYTEMTIMERRFSDVCRQICLPISQTQVYNDLLNAEERQILEAGTKADIKRIDSKQIGPLQSARPFFDVLCGNGQNNIDRIAEHRKLDPRRLALDFSLTLGLLRGQVEHQLLVKEFCGEDLELPVPGVQIDFRNLNLYIDDDLEAEFKNTKKSRTDFIMLSFQETKWQQKEINVSSGFKNRRALRDCVRNLNARTKRIKFNLVGDFSVRWELIRK